MGIVSGAALVLVGLIGPAWMSPLGSSAVSADTLRSGNGQNVLVPGQWPIAAPLPGRLAGTPPMGWNGYNRFHLSVNAATVEAEARALVQSGMKDAGYTYVNLDGGWDLRQRSLNGSLQPDPQKFPDGIRPLADYVHSLGLKFGIYISAGAFNCAHTSAGSYGHYAHDAATFASWHVDYLKFDWCFIPYHQYPKLTRRQVGELLAVQMADALAATGRPILYDVNDYWGGDHTWTWAPKLAHMWRTAQDSRDNYPSMLANFKANVGHFSAAGPGAWNDPDMLEIGNGGMSATEYQAQFSLWAEMASPLIAGNDLTDMSAGTRSILTNEAVIAVDQDRLGKQGYPVSSHDGHWVLTRPLSDGDRAVVLFNETNEPAVISTTVVQVGAVKALLWWQVNLWDGTVTPTDGPITASVPPHGVVMFLISGQRPVGWLAPSAS